MTADRAVGPRPSHPSPPSSDPLSATSQSRWPPGSRSSTAGGTSGGNTGRVETLVGGRVMDALPVSDGRSNQEGGDGGGGERGGGGGASWLIGYVSALARDR